MPDGQGATKPLQCIGIAASLAKRVVWMREEALHLFMAIGFWKYLQRKAKIVTAHFRCRECHIDSSTQPAASPPV